MPGYPTQTAMEEPLLRAMLRRGGDIWFSIDGIELEIELAEELHVSDENRDFKDDSLPSPHRKWRNHIQWVRKKLVEKGEIKNNTEKDHWSVSDDGYRRLGLMPPRVAE
jgi:hypothetical protein